MIGGVSSDTKSFGLTAGLVIVTVPFATSSALAGSLYGDHSPAPSCTLMRQYRSELVKPAHAVGARSYSGMSVATEPLSKAGVVKSVLVDV
jgi:hypothetical protein